MPATDAGDQALGLRVAGIAEAQGVQQRDRPRAHGEDVAHDAADAGGRALVGLDVGGVVVALHLEDAGLAVADVDDAGVLAGPQITWGPWWGTCRGASCGLVGAVLGPHHREHAQLDVVGLAVQAPDDEVVFVGFRPYSAAFSAMVFAGAALMARF
jgi:hypothetical protein